MAKTFLAPFMIHELLLSPTETASGSHPCRVVSITYHRPSYFHGGSNARDRDCLSIGNLVTASAFVRTNPDSKECIGLKSTVEPKGHLSGDATIWPSGEKPVLTRPSPLASDVSRGHASLSSTMPASASIARVLPAFLFSILSVLPPQRSPRIRRVSVMASQR